MKVAVITSGFLPVPPTKGGAVENLLFNLIKQNEEEQKVQFIIYSNYEKQAEEIAKKYKNTKVIFIKSNIIVETLDRIAYFIAKYFFRKKNSQSYRFIFQRLNYLNKVSKSLKNENYDKVLLENHPTQYLALKWRKNHLKYIDRYYYHCHNEFPGEYGCHDIIKNTKKILCVSQYIKNKLKKYQTYSQKIVVLRNGVDEKFFNSEKSKEKCNKLRNVYNIEKNDVVFLYTGRIVPEKGVYELIKAFNSLNEKNLKLLIVGSSLNAIKNKTLYEKKIEQEIKENKNIIFTGFIKYKDIPDIYKIADVAVLPSLWNDPAPLSVIEAMRCGLAIITTNSGGIPEYAKENNAIILNKENDIIKELALSMQKIAKDKEMLSKMKKNSEENSKNLTLKEYYKEFIKEMS